MVKEKEVNKADEPVSDKINPLQKTARNLLFFMIIGAAGYFVWQNPQLVDKAKTFFESSAVAPEEENRPARVSETDLLRQEIDGLKRQMGLMEKMLAEKNDNGVLEDRFDNLERANSAIIDSKADVAAVLGLVTRMDKAEQQLDELSMVTDKGAVVLTAAMLVKDSAERGGSFAYEAEILQQLAGDNAKIKNQVAVISKYAEKGIESNIYLIKSFKKVYADLLQKQREAYEKTWKDRLNNKISEYIKVKRVKEDAPAFQANQELAGIKKSVDAGNIKKALADLQNINNKELLNEQSLKDWVAEARAKVEFNEAVAQISAYYLSALKVNFIVKEIKHD